jgi:hypothetical protein
LRIYNFFPSLAGTHILIFFRLLPTGLRRANRAYLVELWGHNPQTLGSGAITHQFAASAYTVSSNAS